MEKNISGKYFHVSREAVSIKDGTPNYDFSTKTPYYSRGYTLLPCDEPLCAASFFMHSNHSNGVSTKLT